MLAAFGSFTLPQTFLQPPAVGVLLSPAPAPEFLLSPLVLAKALHLLLARILYKNRASPKLLCFASRDKTSWPTADGCVDFGILDEFVQRSRRTAREAGDEATARLPANVLLTGFPSRSNPVGGNKKGQASQVRSAAERAVARLRAADDSSTDAGAGVPHIEGRKGGDAEAPESAGLGGGGVRTDRIVRSSRGGIDDLLDAARMVTSTGEEGRSDGGGDIGGSRVGVGVGVGESIGGGDGGSSGNGGGASSSSQGKRNLDIPLEGFHEDAGNDVSELYNEASTSYYLLSSRSYSLPSWLCQSQSGCDSNII